MGLLSQGVPLSAADTKRLAAHIRQHGVKQFISLYQRHKNRADMALYWGDEIEYLLIKFDRIHKKVYLALKQQDVLRALAETTESDTNSEGMRASWNPEMCEYMVEAIPATPYGGSVADFKNVQENMRRRRRRIQTVLSTDEAVMTFPVFPLLGVGTFTSPKVVADVQDEITRSLFFPASAFNQGHPRFENLSRNITSRRREKISINIPIYRDLRTPSPFIEDFTAVGDDGEAAEAARPDHIYMDAVGFGLGNCCLQVTFLAANLDEARYLYDQLAVMCPIMTAVSAGSPMFRGYLSDIDNRWPVNVQSCDDRTREERGLEPLTNERFRLHKSRYDSIDSYISPLGRQFNNIDVTFDPDIFDELIHNGVDDLLARHVARLFTRDTISVFWEKVDQDDDTEIDHFENINSTNWNTMRLKPPPTGSEIGWRVEFRPMDVQITDFENAALTVFLVLLTRVMLTYRLNVLIPMSKLEENMENSSKRRAVVNERFYFRKNILPGYSCHCHTRCGGDICTLDVKEDYTLMTLFEIFHGKDGFPGLLALINKYLDSIEVDVESQCIISMYLKFISMRVSGDIDTNATWMRQVVTFNPEYKQDSVVPEAAVYDLITRMSHISSLDVKDPMVLANCYNIDSPLKSGLEDSNSHSVPYKRDVSKTHAQGQ